MKRMRIPLLAPLLAIGLLGLAGAAVAQVDHKFPGISSGQLTPPIPPSPAPGPPVAPYPNTESVARDRIQSQGFKVQRIERQVDGSWKADANRVPSFVPPAQQQQRVPSKVTIFPDGRMVEE